MKTFSPKYLKKTDPRQTEREERKAASRRASVLDGAELSFIGPDGSKYYVHKPVSIPGYTHSF